MSNPLPQPGDRITFTYTDPYGVRSDVMTRTVIDFMGYPVVFLPGDQSDAPHTLVNFGGVLPGFSILSITRSVDA